MTPLAIATVRASHAVLAPRMDQLVDAFYTGLFQAHPPTRALFPPDMTRQRDHLAAALAVLLRNLDSFEVLEESLMSLGARHVDFGVRPEHYHAFRDVMLQSLRTVAQPAWSSQVEGAWREVLNRICACMLRGAAGATIAAAQKFSSGPDAAQRNAS
jgi:hemoglobin-like flavoprotein